LSSRFGGLFWSVLLGITTGPRRLCAGGEKTVKVGWADIDLVFLEAKRQRHDELTTLGGDMQSAYTCIRTRERSRKKKLIWARPGPIGVIFSEHLRQMSHAVGAGPSSSLGRPEKSAG